MGLRPDRTAPSGSPTNANNSIGRITTTGKVTNYAGTGSTARTGSPPGPDGALWFTNPGNNSIGRITTTGNDHQLHRPQHQQPDRRSRPGPTAHSGSPITGNNSIGRITTTGTVTNYTDPEHQRPGRHHGRAGRRAVVHQLRQQLDRTDHHHRRRSPTTPAASISSPIGITAGPDGALWFTNYGNNSIGRITTAGTVTNYTRRRHRLLRPRITAGPDGALVVHQPRRTTRSGASPPTGTVTNYTGAEHQRPVRDRDRTRTARCGSPTSRQRLDRAHHHRRHRHELHRPPASQQPGWDHAGPDGALWFTNNGNNSIGRITTTGDGHELHRPGIDAPSGIAAGPDGALWFTNSGNNSIGRITTTGTVTKLHRHRHQAPTGSRPDPTARSGSPTAATTRSDGSPRPGRSRNYTGAGIDDPIGITAGPDGALWFTNSGNNSIGRITTTGTVTNYTDPEHQQPRRHRGRARRRAVVHQQRQQLDRADHHDRHASPTTPTPASIPGGDHGRARRRALVHEPATTRSVGSPRAGR